MQDSFKQTVECSELNLYSKFHSNLVPALEQVKFFHGIGGTWEDGVVNIH